MKSMGSRGWLLDCLEPGLQRVKTVGVRTEERTGDGKGVKLW